MAKGWIGRTSTEPPTSRIGQPFESSAACSKSRAWISVKPPTTSLASANGPSVTLFCLPLTTFPECSSGWPISFKWPCSPSCLNHARHFSIVFCICSGEALVSLPRYKKVKSLIVIPPTVFCTSTVLTVEKTEGGHIFFDYDRLLVESRPGSRVNHRPRHHACP